MITLPFSLSLAHELKSLEDHGSLTLVNVGNTTAKATLVHSLTEQVGANNVFWVSSDEKADQMEAVVKLFFPGRVHIIPEKVTEKDFYAIRAALKHHEKTLFLFEHFDEVLTQTFPDESFFEEEKITLEKGKSVAVYKLFESLEKRGFEPAEDSHLKPGEFLRQGDILYVFPLEQPYPYRVQLFGDEIELIDVYDQEKKASVKVVRFAEILPAKFAFTSHSFVDTLKKFHEDALFIRDDIDDGLELPKDLRKVVFTTFPKNDEIFFHLNYFSVLPYYTIADFITDIKDRFRRSFDIVILTKKKKEIESIFKEYETMYTYDLKDKTPSTVKIIEHPQDRVMPHSFQNNERKQLFLTDREIFQFYRNSRQKKAVSGMNMDLLTSLKPGDFVVHLDHGVSRFSGIIQRDLGAEFGGVKEYLKLEYAENDKLFVPVESAEKVSKFIGDEAPKLTKLGGSEWAKSQSKLKEEAEKIAGELLKLYAAREMAKGSSFSSAAKDDRLDVFCSDFPYELTPGQSQSWLEVNRDMEHKKPMDRLVCGDVGFGKTEIALRAAFKCAVAGYQAVILAPITILAEQHYQNLQKRMGDRDYGIRVALLSRFQSPSEQKKVLEDLEKGLVDIVVGTHRLLSPDVKFKKLGLCVIDEEQRFGVKQKEKLKSLRTSVDILTMTATPIPRTLHMGLNRLKDVSTITTPPPGRLPVVTEVRKYNLNLIRERILAEIERGGQIYFLHNEVKTIEGLAGQLRSLIPEATFIVAHGQLSPLELEERIRAFKDKEADVLIASTIIENGIDLKDANTLIVNRAEKFGLSQLYQLRGRVGRSRTQAYAYFLYHGQKLELEAKKRLRAIVEASELGAGFQIAMRDLEIRGAGDILGASQSGALKTVGVSHFLRLLNKTIEELKSGEISSDVEEEESITVEIPMSAYIPTSFIPDVNEKIQLYKELAAASSLAQLKELKKDLREDFGILPKEVEGLFKVLSLKMLLREARLEGIKIHQLSHKSHEIVLRMGKGFTPDQVFGLIKNSENKWVITAQALKLAVNTLSVNWYENLEKEIQMLIPEKKGK